VPAGLAISAMIIGLATGLTGAGLAGGLNGGKLGKDKESIAAFYEGYAAMIGATLCILDMEVDASTGGGDGVGTPNASQLLGGYQGS